ncbi:hypothetical protein KVV02_005020 [Mortierella alpina]|uniref:Uncharacterized protein n=1 Tax=Mortierella alpina TaxID=64518 RepID=A0A9P7ZZ26_MORAP|nr:hypothetical protein KVV02_005020 [Mortierella alpina]
MLPVAPSSLYKRMSAVHAARMVIRGIPAGLVISMNAWAVSAWLKATILINSQPRWLFRKKRWSEAEMRAISCYYLVVAYLMLRVVRLASTLAKRPGRPYGDFFRNTRPILGQVAIFSLATMAMDEFIMFYILRKFGLEKRRFLITGRPLDKEVEVGDDDCCICYGAMLDDDDSMADQEDMYHSSAGEMGLSKDTDHVLENFCVVKQHVAHRGCIRKWYNYGPKGYRPMEAFRILNWGATLHGAVAGMHHGSRVVGSRFGLDWLLSLSGPTERHVQLRMPLVEATLGAVQGPNAVVDAEVRTTHHRNHQDTQPHDTQYSVQTQEPRQQHQHQHQQQQQQALESETPDLRLAPSGLEPLPTQEIEQTSQNQERQESNAAADAAEPVLRPLFPQQDDYSPPIDAGRKTCPACRQQLVLNFVDLAKGRREMGWVQKLMVLGRDITKFSDWRGLILRSLITAGWVGVTIVGGKLRIVAIDKAIAKHQKNRALATLSALAAP